MTLATPRAIRFGAALYSSIRYALATGIRLGEVPAVDFPFAREGMRDTLIIARMDLEGLKEIIPKDQKWWLRQVVMATIPLEQIMDDAYDPRGYGHRVRELMALPQDRLEKTLWEKVNRLEERRDALPDNKGDAVLEEFKEEGRRAGTDRGVT